MAWLTIDEFRWHHHIPGIPEDLNYGLVLNYTKIICEYFTFGELKTLNSFREFAGIKPSSIPSKISRVMGLA
ncbi:hypothetical protein [Synechococcus sp. PCC 6312]|uniref:hypothetical protein n=1 Tax=Synechococcus sp. (strain ATCC 27167 / PCC 6312) TaxID=195253 RepID=UPI00029F4CDB|nr:hypothetical protein [Synechococcus sp. PCC 6312]AFY60776.1 hypothetical protein Syn6312_1616 [Synechococcus sp. PCC 6312]